MHKKIVILKGPLRSYNGKYKFELGKPNSTQIICGEDIKLFIGNDSFLVVDLPEDNNKAEEIKEDIKEEIKEEEVEDVLEEEQEKRPYGSKRKKIRV